MRGVYERYWRFLEYMLQDGKQDGSVRRDVDPALYAHVIIAAHTGMLVEWFVIGEPLTRDLS